MSFPPNDKIESIALTPAVSDGSLLAMNIMFRVRGTGLENRHERRTYMEYISDIDAVEFLEQYLSWCKEGLCRKKK